MKYFNSVCRIICIVYKRKVLLKHHYWKKIIYFLGRLYDLKNKYVIFINCQQKVIEKDKEILLLRKELSKYTDIVPV
jgi:hypothetical protein